MSGLDDQIAKLSWEIEGLSDQLKRLRAEKGKIESARLLAKMVKTTCPACDGHGSFGNDTTCERCEGKGYLLAVPFVGKTRACDEEEIRALLELSEIDR